MKNLTKKQLTPLQIAVASAIAMSAAGSDALLAQERTLEEIVVGANPFRAKLFLPDSGEVLRDRSFRSTVRHSVDSADRIRLERLFIDLAARRQRNGIDPLQVNGNQLRRQVRAELPAELLI